MMRALMHSGIMNCNFPKFTKNYARPSEVTRADVDLPQATARMHVSPMSSGSSHNLCVFNPKNFAQPPELFLINSSSHSFGQNAVESNLISELACGFCAFAFPRVSVAAPLPKL